MALMYNLDHKFRVASREDIYTVIEETGRLAKERFFAEREVIFLQLAAEEACTNAWDYGSSEEGIDVEWYSHAHAMEIIVWQRGASFDIHQLPQMMDGPSGRGLMLIRGLMDRVELCVNGPFIELRMVLNNKNPQGRPIP